MVSKRKVYAIFEETYRTKFQCWALKWTQLMALSGIDYHIKITFNNLLDIELSIKTKWKLTY